MTREEFLQLLRKKRLEKEWSLQKLANKLECHRSYPGKVEQGVRTPMDERLIRRWSKLLGIDLGLFLKYTKEYKIEQKLAQFNPGKVDPGLIEFPFLNLTDVFNRKKIERAKAILLWLEDYLLDKDTEDKIEKILKEREGGILGLSKEYSREDLRRNLFLALSDPKKADQILNYLEEKELKPP